MKKVLWCTSLVAVLMLGVVLPAFAANEFGIGGGVYYNRQLGSLDKDKWKIDKDYISYVFSLKYQLLDFLGVEGMLDYYPGKDDIDYTFRPSATVVLGSFINVGLGINGSYVKYKKPDTGSTKSEWSDLAYHFKAGLQIPLSVIWINADAYYYVDELKNIEDFDKDFITFGVRVHYVF